MVRLPSPAARRLLALALGEVGQLLGVGLPLIQAARAPAANGRQRRRRLRQVVATTLAARALASACKVAFRRPRPARAGAPAPRGHAFPSGHATSAACGAWIWAAVAAAQQPRGPRLRLTRAVAVCAALTTAYGRVAGGRHRPEDVVAGLALGALVGYLGASQISLGLRPGRPSHAP